ncbi:hypothetical protein AN221_37195 [Streptomyces nanshensis]|uniref:Uncharacterized protein n=1 Tax=Streptomyces nanshensis TaxID=518642 RepID=A0A1E7LHR3_9ACTN|nr:hypothetical protein AN221_37195 [Streptomyces nanshensis]
MSISSQRSFSRSGSSLTAAESSVTASAWRPASSMSAAHSSTAVSRRSRSRVRSTAAKGPGTPEYASPCQSARASSYRRTASSGLPPVRALRARA